MTMFYKEERIRNIIAKVYKQLNKDYETLMDEGQYDSIAYDLGYINALCLILGKQELGQQIYDKFME